MPHLTRIETAIDASLARATAKGAPRQLSDALHYALKPGGARIRPTILLSVSMACGDKSPALSEAAAAALELIHCASLVHDDMPCFDGAAMRRGKPSVHVAFDEGLALLVGDTLIVQAFETLARQVSHNPCCAGALITELAHFTGAPHGICAGQAWETEPHIDLSAYHRAKTGALFTAATRMGARAAGQDPEPWTDLGARIGEAFQVADDLLDVLATEDSMGKPNGQDARHDRPSAVRTFGLKGAMQRLDDILAAAIASIPSCPGEAALAALVRKTAERLTPVMPTQTPAE